MNDKQSLKLFEIGIGLESSFLYDNLPLSWVKSDQVRLVGIWAIYDIAIYESIRFPGYRSNISTKCFIDLQRDQDCIHYHSNLIQANIIRLDPFSPIITLSYNN